ncbi:MAG: hypothetical protein WAU86_20795 [Oricola sp.]
MADDTGSLVRALDHLRSGDFAVGPDWEKAHEICQEHEGEPAFDWVHALCHRIEGDDWNAGYWYRRAGRDRRPGSVEEEWRAIRREIAPAA